MLPEVCALRGGVCALSDEPCAAPCAALGFARAIRHMGYQHWTLQQVLERLCNPREYASDDEYARLVGEANLRKLMKTFGLDEVLAAIGGDA